MDVKWPTPSLALEPQHFDTYPSQPVLANLEYSGVTCTPSQDVPMPVYTLQLIYCGASVVSCDPSNKTLVQVTKNPDFMIDAVNQKIYVPFLINDSESL